MILPERQTDMNKRFKQWINSALDFVFPQHLKCHSCSKEAAVNEYGICSECEAGLAVNPLTERIEFVDEYAAGLFYNDVSKRAVYALKYNGAVYVREFLTHFMCIPADWPIDCIVPVPLHPRREKERGFNQSFILAKSVAERYNINIRAELLKRVRDTSPQVGMNAKLRAKNLNGAFEASPECAGLSVLLVDDVRTTGATLKECASELKKHGAARVHALTACCTPPESN